MSRESFGYCEPVGSNAETTYLLPSMTAQGRMLDNPLALQPREYVDCFYLLWKRCCTQCLLIQRAHKVRAERTLRVVLPDFNFTRAISMRTVNKGKGVGRKGFVSRVIFKYSKSQKGMDSRRCNHVFPEKGSTLITRACFQCALGESYCPGSRLNCSTCILSRSYPQTQANSYQILRPSI